MHEFKLPPRTVYLPLKSIDKCGVCSKTTKLRLCPCAESIYCSSECQERDWKKHKLSCGKTERLELGAFYPVFAISFEKFHSHTETGIHPALRHTILNNPHPNEIPTKLPGGRFAKLVILGDPLADQRRLGGAEWWPDAPTEKVRSKLFRRITREGNLLVKVVAICLGILAEFYTTTSSADKKDTRYRLRVGSSPVADFGISCGSVRVTRQDRLAYWYHFPDEESIVEGQNPDDHYWIYFTTTRGQVFTLECGMFTFNMCTMIDTTQYQPPNDYWSFMMQFAPAFFRDRELQKNAPEVHHERRRFSVLRDASLHAAIAHSGEGLSVADAEKINAFAGLAAGRECTEKEKRLLPVYTLLACEGIGEVLQSEIYRCFPNRPAMAIEQDPNETDGMDEHAGKYWEFLQNWKKLKKEGKVGNQTKKDAFREYQRLFMQGGRA